MSPLLVDNQKFTDNKPRVSANPYPYDIAEGVVSGHEPFTQIGYHGTLEAESDIWSATGVYAFPTAAGRWEVLSSDNTQDFGTILKSATADAGGSTTTLVDADAAGFGGAAAGDLLILDKSGTSPEYGFITTAAATVLTCAGGFSKGGVGTSRTYDVVDFSPFTGAQAVQVCYLTSAFAQKEEIVILNGSTPVLTVNNDCYRLNCFRMIASGVTGGLYRPKGALTVRPSGGGSTYGHITANFTRARSAIYTVPAGKALYVSQMASAYGVSGTSNKHYARIYLRANYMPGSSVSTGFNTGKIFYPFAEFLMQNIDVPIIMDEPIRFPAGIDVKISGFSTLAGAASVAMRGWLEDPTKG
jgi:hypothetical protein